MAVPSDDHLLAFGRIMHAYAAVESGIKIAMSAILEIDLAFALVVFEPYGARDVKNVAKSLGKMRLKSEHAEQFCMLVGEWSGYGAMRNLIAHTRWTKGTRPNSIKPLGLSIREGEARFIGHDDDEKCYTPKDLNSCLAQLDSINERLKQFLKTSGLERIIAEKMLDESEARS